MTDLPVYHLYNWSVVPSSDDPYTPPEMIYPLLKGIKEDEVVYTISSKIMAVDGRRITTRNSVYVLQDIDPNYLKWIHDNGYEYNYDNPIKNKVSK